MGVCSQKYLQREDGSAALLLCLVRVVPFFFVVVRITFSFSHTAEVCLLGMRQSVPVCSCLCKGSQKTPETGCVERLDAV